MFKVDIVTTTILVTLAASEESWGPELYKVTPGLLV